MERPGAEAGTASRLREEQRFSKPHWAHTLCRENKLKGQEGKKNPVWTERELVLEIATAFRKITDIHGKLFFPPQRNKFVRGKNIWLQKKKKKFSLVCQG